MTLLFYFACVFYHFSKEESLLFSHKIMQRVCRIFTVWFAWLLVRKCLKESSQPSQPQITGVYIYNSFHSCYLQFKIPPALNWIAVCVLCNILFFTCCILNIFAFQTDALQEQYFKLCILNLSPELLGLYQHLIYRAIFFTDHGKQHLNQLTISLWVHETQEHPRMSQQGSSLSF